VLKQHINRIESKNKPWCSRLILLYSCRRHTELITSYLLLITSQSPKDFLGKSEEVRGKK
jgi:hypothetical protein